MPLKNNTPDSNDNTHQYESLEDIIHPPKPILLSRYNAKESRYSSFKDLLKQDSTSVFSFAHLKSVFSWCWCKTDDSPKSSPSSSPESTLEEKFVFMLTSGEYGECDEVLSLDNDTKPINTTALR